MHTNLELIVISVTIGVIMLICLFVISAVMRRIVRNRKFKKLDQEKETCREQLMTTLTSDLSDQGLKYVHARKKSMKWKAVEDVLFEFIGDDRYTAKVITLFSDLGYVSYYEKKLKSSSRITRASAIDSLGKMHSEQSEDKIIEMLSVRNTEIVTVAVRSLSRMKSIPGLRHLLDRLPELFRHELISRKVVETALVHYGIDAVPYIIQYGKTCQEASVVATLLEVLSNVRSTDIVSFAEENIRHENPEVRSKAVKALGTIITDVPEFDPDNIVPLLQDPVWFVQLQAVKLLGGLRHVKAADVIGELLLDNNWQVRSAAAVALTNIGDTAIDVMLKTLRTTDDTYAKECICEEIGKSDLIHLLINNLGNKDENVHGQSKEILRIMHSFNFSTPLNEYIEKGPEMLIKKELRAISEGEPES